jgi:hypothetical protein
MMPPGYNPTGDPFAAAYTQSVDAHAQMRMRQSEPPQRRSSGANSRGRGKRRAR